jgi:hypothetical protein
MPRTFYHDLLESATKAPTTRTEDRIRQAMVASLVAGGVTLAGAALTMLMIALSPPVVEHGATSLPVRTMLLVYFVTLATVLVLQAAQRTQARSRARGMHIERALEALVPFYVNFAFIRVGLLTPPALLSLGALLATGEVLLVLAPLTTVGLMVLTCPSSRRYDRFVRWARGKADPQMQGG